jgi:hypothetical protein
MHGLECGISKLKALTMLRFGGQGRALNQATHYTIYVVPHFSSNDTEG